MIKKKLPYKYTMMISFFVMVVVVFLSFGIGRFSISPLEVFEVVTAKIFGTTHDLGSNYDTVLFAIRLPRIILALLVGMAISLAGACYQGIFQNPMASPDILGASSGAAFGASFSIVLRLAGGWISMWAFVFSILSVVIVLVISKHTRSKKVVGIILTGIMVGNLFSAGTSFIKLIADPNDQLPEITYWLMGGFSGVDMVDVKFLLIPLIIGVIPLLGLRWKMNVLTLGDDEARSMGVNTTRVRTIIIICATLITAASVSVSGMIGWVGLIVPNMMRKLVGNDFKKLLPMTMIVGGIFLLIVDNFARTLFATELPLSILTSVIGAPFFMYLITRKGD